MQFKKLLKMAQNKDFIFGISKSKTPRFFAVFLFLSFVFSAVTAQERNAHADSTKPRLLDSARVFATAPVSLSDYVKRVEQQAVQGVDVSKDELASTLADLVLPPRIIRQLGTAVGSGRGIADKSACV